MEWYTRACVDFSITAFDLLDPSAVVFRPDRKMDFPNWSYVKVL